MKQIRQTLARQFAMDYHCAPEGFADTRTLVTAYAPHAGARHREEAGLLSILTFGGKLVMTAAPELVPWCEQTLAKRLSAPWCFEADSLVAIDRKLEELGYTIDQVHLFFVPEGPVPEPALPVKLLDRAEIAPLQSDRRIDEAFLFSDDVPDMLGAAVCDRSGKLLAVAGASANSALLWEMGVNSFSEGRGCAQAALRALTRAVLQQGKVPYYGTAMSHLASQRVALGAGLTPAFAELTTKKR